MVSLDILLLTMEETFIGKQHLGLIDILQLSESPVIFLPSIIHQRFVLWQSPSTPDRYPLILHLEISQEWRNICNCIGVPSWVLWWYNYMASIVDKQDWWCGACASLLISVIVWDGLPKFWPIEVCLDSNVIHSVRGFPTCCLAVFLILPYRRVLKVPG